MSLYSEENKQISEMQQNFELLKDLPFFANFPDKAMRLLAFLAERTALSPDDILFEEGDDQGRAYLVLSGQLHLLKKHGNGKLVVQQFGQGDFLGSFALLGSLPSLFILQASTKAAVLSLHRDQFAKILEHFPETGKIALTALLQKLGQWERSNLAEAKTCCLKRTGATVL
jgi:CRP/FNR family transcriptional regulator, cyclic AMP receptor protein